MTHSASKTSPFRVARRPLRLEHLEDRTTPATTITVDAPAMVITVGGDANEVVAVGVAGGGQVQVVSSVSGTLTSTTLANAVTSLTVNLDGQNQTLNLAGVTPAGFTALTAVAVVDGGGTDTLQFPDVAQTVTIAGADSGTSTAFAAFAFTDIENLVGSSAADTFVFADGATLSGTIDGGAGTDTLDYSAYTTPVAVNLGANAPGLTATMTADQEVPPTTSTATGIAAVTYNNVAHTFDITVTVDGIAPADVTGFHLHRAPFGVDGPIILDLLAVGVMTPTATGFTYTATGLALNPLHEAALLGGLIYVNVHTAADPGGAIRGQLEPSAPFVDAPGTATGTAGVSNVENATGGSGSFTVSGTAFGDGLVGDKGVNVLRGGPGNDVLVGAQGNDTVQGEGDNDILVWSNGDNTDVMDGGAGVDRVQVNGAVGKGDVFTVGPGAGGRLAFARTNLVPFGLDIGTVEQLAVLGLSGDDTFTVSDLAGVADLSSVLLAGLDGNDTFDVTPQGAVQVTVQGGPPSTAPGDTLTVTGLAGTTNPQLTGVTTGPGASRSGSWTFGGGPLPIAFTGIETLSGTADLGVVKTAGAGPVFPGGTVTYTIVVTNTGPVSVPGVLLTDTFPGLTGVTFTAVAAGGATGFTASGTTQLFDVLNLPAGSSVTYTVSGTVTGTAGGTLTNTATLTVPPGVIEPDTANNTSTVSRPIVAPPAVLVGVPDFAAGPDAGLAPTVTYYNPDATAKFSLTPFDASFTGGVRVAVGDFNGDGIPDLAVGTGPGVATSVRVFDGATKAELFSVAPFEATFTGGVYVAAGDLNGDGKADLVISPDQGGGPRVRIFSGAGFGQLADFFGIEDVNFRGGARAAVGDINGDGTGDLLVAAGFGGGPRIAVFNGATLFTPPATPGALPPKLFGDFFVFENTLRNGVFIASGDLNGDGFAEVIAGGGPGGGPRVFALSGKDLIAGSPVQLANFFGGDVTNRGGIRIAVKNLDGDNRADLVVGAGTGAGSRVTGYLGKTVPADGTPPEQFTFDAFPGFAGGVFVG
jgi:uncharacterized repeat protein (TIGR01451 family)